MRMNASQGKSLAVATKKVRSSSKNERFSASLSTPDSTVAARKFGFWNSHYIDYVDYTDYTYYTDHTEYADYIDYIVYID